jgi:hypothetical protein
LEEDRDRSPNTFSLAAYLGRLYAVTGTKSAATLWWRSAVATKAYKEPSLLFVRGGGHAAVATLAGNGDIKTTGSTSDAPDYSIVCRVKDGMVLFLRPDGSGTLGRFAANGTFTNVRTPWGAGTFAAWSQVVYFDNGVNEHVFFYGGSTGLVGRFDPVTGNFTQEWVNNAFGAWTHITAANNVNRNANAYLMFYKASTGEYAVARIGVDGRFFTLAEGGFMPSGFSTVVAAGQSFLLFQRSDGSAALVEYTAGPEIVATLKTWPAGTFVCQLLGSNANGVVLLLKSDHSATARGFFPPTAGELGYVDLRTYLNEFSPWSNILSIGTL